METKDMTMIKFPAMIAASALVLVTACADQGGPNDNFQARNGAAIGAGLGVLAGVISFARKWAATSASRTTAKTLL